MEPRPHGPSRSGDQHGSSGIRVVTGSSMGRTIRPPRGYGVGVINQPLPRLPGACRLSHAPVRFHTGKTEIGTLSPLIAGRSCINELRDVLKCYVAPKRRASVHEDRFAIRINAGIGRQ